MGLPGHGGPVLQRPILRLRDLPTLHPEIFRDAHRLLDTNLGAINTTVLIFSSLTMAWAVRCAQLDQRRGLLACLSITLVCASVFLGIKFVEYHHKWEHHLLWGEKFKPDEESLAKMDTGPHGGQSAVARTTAEVEARRRDTGIFFSIYFCMTGLHGLHVIAGMAVIAWLLIFAYRGRFGSRYYSPVDFVALYWHFVNLVWIFLFPLFYLIH